MSNLDDLLDNVTTLHQSPSLPVSDSTSEDSLLERLAGDVAKTKAEKDGGFTLSSFLDPDSAPAPTRASLPILPAPNKRGWGGGGGGGWGNWLTGDPAEIGQTLAKAWVKRFGEDDRRIKWIEIEQEYSLQLAENVILVGKIDAVGESEAGVRFFGEWKTQNPPPKNRKEWWKLDWKMSPQALTYGVLVESRYPGIRRFTVRKAFKSDPPTFDYEWFEYSTEEIAWWRSELIEIAGEIRRLRLAGVGSVPWSPNFKVCFKYGPEYVCPRFYRNCSTLMWNHPPENVVEWESHLEVEKEIRKNNIGMVGRLINKKLVILDATRVDKWMDCRERYRGDYELGVRDGADTKEALDIGTELHEILSRFYSQMKEDE